MSYILFVQWLCLYFLRLCFGQGDIWEEISLGAINSKANNCINNMTVYSGPRSLKIVMHTTNSESPLQILLQKASKQLFKTGNYYTLLQRGTEENRENSWWQSRNCLKGRTNSLSILLFPATDLYFLNDIRQQCQRWVKSTFMRILYALFLDLP